MKRRRRVEEHVNHERWAIPYGDLITLLLALFVVMYAMSAVNASKSRAASQSIVQAFNGSSRVITPQPIVPAAPADAAPSFIPQTLPPGSVLTPITLPQTALPDPLDKPAADKPDAQQANLQTIQGQVEKALQPLIDKKLVVLRRTPSWLEIEIRTDILFPSGAARLAAPADQVLSNLGGILAPFPNPLRVEGYTDDQPINTAVYPSNWELSAARAASVARLFAEHGVSPNRLGIIGWGQFRPATSNDTVDGRNRNRRVLVVVLSDHDAPSRFTSDAAGLDQLAAQSQPPKDIAAPDAVPTLAPAAKASP